jgi:hypothetical protein
MLNIGKLAHGGAEYYLTTVATSVEAYYTGAGKAPGRWLGTASARLGLDGLVSAETLRTVLAGPDPADGQPLVGHARTVPGFDLTFGSARSAPTAARRRRAARRPSIVRCRAHGRPRPR